MSHEHMNDKELEAVLREWTPQAPAGQPDRSRTVGNVVGQLGHTRRRRHRRWPFSWHRREGTHSASEQAPAQQPNPIPAANRHTPIVIGRTQSMLSPAKAITAGALVFALGGAMLISQPFEQQGSVPAAETEAVAPTWVTGTIEPVDDSCERGPVTSAGGVTRSAYECRYTWTSTDPRLTGDVSAPWIEDTYQMDEGVIAVGIEAWYVQNESGSWACWSEYLAQGATPTEPVYDNTFTCVGSGGHEGLTSVLVTTPTTGEFAMEFVGLVFSGDLPPVPEPPAAK